MGEALGTSLLVFDFPGGRFISSDQVVDTNENGEGREIDGKTRSQG